MNNSDILSLAELRIDGRRYDELRTIKHKMSLFAGNDGSAYLEQGDVIDCFSYINRTVVTLLWYVLLVRSQ